MDLEVVGVKVRWLRPTIYHGLPGQHLCYRDVMHLLFVIRICAEIDFPLKYKRKYKHNRWISKGFGFACVGHGNANHICISVRNDMDGKEPAKTTTSSRALWGISGVEATDSKHAPHETQDYTSTCNLWTGCRNQDWLNNPDILSGTSFIMSAAGGLHDYGVGLCLHDPRQPELHWDRASFKGRCVQVALVGVCRNVSAWKRSQQTSNLIDRRRRTSKSERPSTPLHPGLFCCSYDRYQSTKTRLNSKESRQSGRIIAQLCVNGARSQFKYRMYCTAIKSPCCLNRRAV